MIVLQKETYLLFQNMVYEEHKLRNVEVEKNEEMYLITYEIKWRTEICKVSRSH